MKNSIFKYVILMVLAGLAGYIIMKYGKPLLMDIRNPFYYEVFINF